MEVSEEVTFQVKLKPTTAKDGMVMSITQVCKGGESLKGSFDFVDKESKTAFSNIYNAVIRRFKNGHTA